MQVVILCGGLGTRLREETEYRPKPMVPIGNRPILWHIMKHYARYGHKDFILCLGYKGEVIKDFFRNYQWNTSDVTLTLDVNPKITYLNSHEEEDWTVTMIDTGANTMTGGRLKRVLSHIMEDDFMLTYGDGVSNVDVEALIAHHKITGASATLTAVMPSGRFGELGLNGDLVDHFHEKPKEGHSYINGGFFVMNKHHMAPLLDDDTCILERDPFETLSKRGKLAAFKHDGFWQCMDNIREVALLNELWQSGNAPWKTW